MCFAMQNATSYSDMKAKRSSVFEVIWKLNLEVGILIS